MGNFALQVLHIACAAAWVALLFSHLRALRTRRAEERSGTAAAQQRRRMHTLTFPAALGALATGGLLLARDPLFFRPWPWPRRDGGLLAELLAAGALGVITLHAHYALGALARGNPAPSRMRFLALEEICALLISLTLLVLALSPF